jgi:hypothetical protein
MSDAITFGIVGGYGTTGRVVVSELWKSCKGEILIGGRDATLRTPTIRSTAGYTKWAVENHDAIA